jgi:hypothetical protein
VYVLLGMLFPRPGNCDPSPVHATELNPVIVMRLLLLLLLLWFFFFPRREDEITFQYSGLLGPVKDRMCACFNLLIEVLGNSSHSRVYLNLSESNPRSSLKYLTTRLISTRSWNRSNSECEPSLHLGIRRYTIFFLKKTLSINATLIQHHPSHPLRPVQEHIHAHEPIPKTSMKRATCSSIPNDRSEFKEEK